jgi:hypothetical protein
LAEHGFFVQELNIGWDEWQAGGWPTHRARVNPGEIRCSCSDALQPGEELRP